MQELQPINGIVNGGVLLRRTPYVVQPPTQQQAPLQQTALKCPRCDSLNTKFCYYNNYNLSQPRHFCKNCRRYWTKGGVLRNVPVGGGCRKSKRTSSSKSKQPSTNGKKNGHNSAVDGGLVRIPEVDNAVEVNGDGNSNSNSNNNSNSNGVSCGGLFSDDIGGLINLISNDNNEVSISVNDGGEGGGGGETTSFTEFLQNQEWEMGKIICGVQEEKRTMAVDDEIGDPTVRIEDFLQNRGSNNNNNNNNNNSNVGLSTLDWHLTADNHQGLFDNHTVDHHDYWSQSTSAVHHHHHDPQWSDSTTTHFPLFLP